MFEGAVSNATNIALSVANIAIWTAVVLSWSRAVSIMRSDRALSSAEAASFRFWSSSIVRLFMRSRNYGLTSMSANPNVKVRGGTPQAERPC